MSGSDQNVLRFIAASFPSVWALEVLLALKREQRPWSNGELVRTLRASELVVTKAIDALVAAGLASFEGEFVTYLPASGDIDRSVALVEQLYRTHPDMVRRSIVSASRGSAIAFADAFKLRRHRND